MRKIIICLVMLIGLVASLSAETLGVRTSEYRTYRLERTILDDIVVYLISAHSNDYYYDEISYYFIGSNKEEAETYFKRIWKDIYLDKDYANFFERVGLFNVDTVTMHERFDYLKRDNGSSGYLKVTVKGILD